MSPIAYKIAWKLKWTTLPVIQINIWTNVTHQSNVNKRLKINTYWHHATFTHWLLDNKTYSAVREGENKDLTCLAPGYREPEHNEERTPLKSCHFGQHECRGARWEQTMLSEQQEGRGSKWEQAMLSEQQWEEDWAGVVRWRFWRLAGRHSSKGRPRCVFRTLPLVGPTYRHVIILETLIRDIKIDKLSFNPKNISLIHKDIVMIYVSSR